MDDKEGTGPDSEVFALVDVNELWKKKSRTISYTKSLVTAQTSRVWKLNSMDLI